LNRTFFDCEGPPFIPQNDSDRRDRLLQRNRIESNVIPGAYKSPIRGSKLLERDRAGIFQWVLTFWTEQFCDEMVILFGSVLSRKWKNKRRV
jgi:hypothetical protein